MFTRRILSVNDINPHKWHSYACYTCKTWYSVVVVFSKHMVLTHLIQILIGILIFSFTKMSLKVSSGKWRPFCLGLNEPMVNYSISDTTIEVACEVEIRHHGSQLTTYHREFYCVCWWSSEARDLIIIKIVLIQCLHKFAALTQKCTHCVHFMFVIMLLDKANFT